MLNSYPLRQQSYHLYIARIMKRIILAFVLLLILIPAGPARGLDDNDILISIKNVPEHGLALAHVDLTEAAALAEIKAVVPENLLAVAGDGLTVPFIFIPDTDFHPSKRVAGTIVCRPNATKPVTLRLRISEKSSKPQTGPEWNGTVKTGSYTVTHATKGSGGFPTQISFPKTGKTLKQLQWHDRLHSKTPGGFHLRGDARAQARLLAKNQIATVVRTTAAYAKGKSQPAPGGPAAVYDWIYFHDLPLVHVRGVITQKSHQSWKEAHFLEIHSKGNELTGWTGGEPLAKGKLLKNDKTHSLKNWAALTDGRNMLAVLNDAPKIHDGKSFGPYIHAQPDLAWRSWSNTRRQHSAWLLIDSGDGSADATAAIVRKFNGKCPDLAQIELSHPAFHHRMAQAKTQLASASAEEAKKLKWQITRARGLQRQGRIKQALDLLDGRLPAACKQVTAGDLVLTFCQGQDGIDLTSMIDTAADRELLAKKWAPLFECKLGKQGDGKEVVLTADNGWKHVKIDAPTAGKSFTIKWRGAKQLGPDADDIAATAIGTLDPKNNRISWQFNIDAARGKKKTWSIRRVVFPQVALADLGRESALLFPRGVGELKQNPCGERFNFGGTYPGGWTCMQIMAYYGQKPAEFPATGLYFSMHDPLGGTKHIYAKSDSANRSLTLKYDSPAPWMDRAGNHFELSGSAVWQLMRGDWYDASMIYRDWAVREAAWYPKLGAEGREDTPKWMRELPVWLLMFGKPETVVPAVEKFAKTMGVPVGVHWYNWHQIPFDDDYPHYFPTIKGFAEGVSRLQSKDIHVMPYINGRLWDTHDRGSEDFQFTSMALPNVTKKEDGSPITEQYHSKQSDGKPVRLGVMCPTTRLWQNKIREVVLRIMNECGTRGVYIDQIAAATPVLCFDRSHGHPTGGGHWWTKGYWEYLDRLNAKIPADRMLTTECNAEPFIKWFDGYLSWHWQYDDQVPCFPAIYGGSIQMFGRAYRGGATKNLAMRMKAAQQLIYGEQIGWFDPKIIDEKENVDFLKQIIALRWHLRRYFHAGRMARPPKPQGDIPNVRADWSWRPNWWVENPALETGCWRLPGQKRAVFFAVNVSDKPITARVKLDLADYGLQGEQLKATHLTAKSPSDITETATTVPRQIDQELTIPPRTASAWEIQ